MTIAVYWNKGAEVLLGKNRKEIVGECLWNAFPEEECTVFIANYSKVIEEDTVMHFEARYEPLDIWVEVSAYPTPKGLSVYFKDITTRKLSEIRLHELNKNLEDYTKELVISNKELEQFSYIVSHNLRAPVANIIGLTEEMKVESHSPEVKKILNNELSSSVKRLDNVIIDLNSILKIKREINEKKETVNLSDLIFNIESSINDQIQRENVQIKTNFKDCYEFKTLKSYLHSIFYNLISNSIKYRQPNSPPLIEINSEKFEKTLVITYKDNGMGIDLQKKGDQVFGLYKRFHPNIEGKGMGLFMVKTQVETLGGKISIKSEVNIGTEFKIEFSSDN